MYSIAKNIQIVIATLKAHGINQLVLSPGGTNAPFIRNVQDDDFFNCYSVVDERSALYFAVGIYLETGKPVAVCCTSAQATRNYLPGLTEAYYKHVPILALTFSKHYRFIGQDYMQAPNQTSLPVDSVRKSFALPYVENDHDFKHCTRLANEALLELMHGIPAPVQLNIPMLDNELGIDNTFELPDIKVIKRYDYKDIQADDLKNKKVLIVVGESRRINDNQIISFAKRNNAAIYVNHLSNMRNDYTVEGNILLSFMEQEEFDSQFCPDILISIGGQTGDYPLFNKLTKGIKCYEHWRISQVGDVVDTYDHLTRVYECTPDEFFSFAWSFSSGHDYYELWNRRLAGCNTSVELPLSNAYTAQQLKDIIPDNSYVNFAILNSLRLWNLFSFKNTVTCYSNVGAFGIDGGLSTFMGQSVKTDNLCFMIIGDLAFYYDMNALSIRHVRNNIRIILINNQGGVEFKLGDNEEARKKTDVYIAAAGHFKKAEGWSVSCGFDYFGVRTKEEFNGVAPALITKSEKPLLIEVFVSDADEATAYGNLRSVNDKRTFAEKLFSSSKKQIKRILK